mgnify:CR=1 FL=1
MLVRRKAALIWRVVTLSAESEARGGAGVTARVRDAATSAQTQARGELFPVYGYADETLLKDMRFKLGAALSGAGLGQTAYARQLLSHARHLLALRRDAHVCACPWA